MNAALGLIIFYLLSTGAKGLLTFELNKIQQTEGKEIHLFGNSSALNYFYANILIGSQQQKQALIIDTGSYITAFPCEPYCVNCGKHMNNRYNISSSSQGEIITCQDNKNNNDSSMNDYCKIILKGKCNEQKECSFNNAYGEGSSISGLYFNDTIWVTDNETKINKVKISLGCIKKENKNFLSQVADGIIGLAPSDMSFTSMLYEEKAIQYKSFSLCLNNINNGILTFGENPQNSKNLIPFYGSDFYRININEVEITKDSVEVGLMGIVDSGTTFTYFPKNIFNKIQMYIYSYCSNIDKCLGDDYISKDRGLCYIVKPHVPIQKFIDSFPMIKFKLENEIEYEWKPENYLLQNLNNTKKKEFCISINGWNQNEILLGSAWMHNHKFIFDLNKREIEIKERNCRANNVTNPLLAELNEDYYFSKYDKDLKNKIHQIIGFVLLAGCGVFWYLYFLLKKKKNKERKNL